MPILILAAGESRRMGALKPTLPLYGRTLLELHIGVYQAAGLAPIGVVLGHRADELSRLVHAPARVILNSRFLEGQFSSIRLGLETLRTSLDVTASDRGIFLTPVDCPPLPPTLLDQLADRLTVPPAPAAVVPTARALPGHPVLLGPRAIQAVLEAPGTTTLEAVLTTPGLRVARLEVADEDILWNLNTPDELERYLLAKPRAWLESLLEDPIAPI